MKNEPIIFANDVVIGLSTIADGNMKAVDPRDENEVAKNQKTFLSRTGFAPSETMMIWLDYDKTDFCRYEIVTKNAEHKNMRKIVGVDGLATTAKNLAIFLPLADCLGAVIYDPKNHALMVSHLGRHSAEQFGARKSIEFMTNQFGTNPRDVRIWLSPTAGAKNYPLFAFDNRSLRDVNVRHFSQSGVLPEKISGGEIDTTTDENYFSHSVAQKTGVDLGKRFAIVAKLR